LTTKANPDWPGNKIDQSLRLIPHSSKILFHFEFSHPYIYFFKSSFSAGIKIAEPFLGNVPIRDKKANAGGLSDA